MQFSNVQSVELAFKRLTGSRLGLLQGGRGHLEVTTLPDFLDKMARMGVEVNATRLRMTQAMYDPSSDGMVFFADRMEAGKEEAVILHELVHKNGHRVLERDQWSSVVDALKGWSAAAPGTVERRIHDWAYEHAEREGRGRPGVLEEELFAYGVEAAVNLGVRPRAEADLNSAESWLYRAQAVIQKVIDAQLGRARLELTAEDLVDLAYAFARIEASPRRAELIAKLREGTGRRAARETVRAVSPYADLVNSDALPAMVVPRVVPTGRLVAPAAASAGAVNRSSANPWETPEFKAWFKSSKVVEPSGRPRVVYHGTNASFSVFKPSETGEMGAGIYFGSEDSAFEYASGDDGDQILPVYLSLQNPLVIRGNYTLGEEKYGVESPAGYLLEHLFGEEGAARRFAEMQDAADNKLGAEIQQAVEALGHDGVVIDWGETDGKPNLWHVAFRPEQVKSVIGNNGDFNADSPSILQSTAPPMFYSQLQRAIEQAPGRLAEMPASQWVNWLTGNASRLGIKAEEMEWSGVLDYLQAAGQKKLTRGDLLSYLSESGVRVQDMGFGGVKAGFNVRPSPSRGGWEAQDPDGHWWGGYASEAEARKAAHSESPTRYHKYVVPGGKNYRELLLTLPTERAPVMRERFTVTDDQGELVAVGMWPPSARSQAYFDEHPDWTMAREIVPDKYDAIKLGAYQSNHWAELNVIAHIRVDERDDGQGRRVLFVHEIQSDWGQEGKRKGFKGDFPQAVLDAAVAGGMSEPQARADIEHLLVEAIATPERDTSEQWDRLTKATSSGDAGGMDLDEVFHNRPREQVVRGPFVMKTEAWVGLAIKRLVSYAAQNGLDAVAFASGVQVSRMFDMSKQVGSIYYDRNGVGKGTLTAMPVGKTIEDEAEPVISEDNVGEGDLERFIGKDLARKLLDSEPGEHGYALVGEDLKLSNDGILAFYDRLLPQIAADVLRRIGGNKPQTLTLPPAVEGEAVASQFAFGIDPVLREKVRAEGLPLFRKQSYVSSPEFREWFKGSQVLTDDGQPLVVFHGTDRDFDQFGKTTDMGFHFGSAGTANRVLRDVSKRAAREKNTDPALRLIPVYLSLKNPVTLSADPGSWMPDYVIKLLQEQGALSAEEASKFDAMALDALDSARAEANQLRNAKIDVRRERHPFLPNEWSYELKHWRWRQVLAQHNAPVFTAIRQALLDKGYDGLKYVNTYERASRKKNDPANISWVAFKPEQIKSALANTGEFDASNPDIARRAAGVTVTPEFQRWFGKSQIRERDGSPLVVYHGTKSDIVEFDPAKTEDGGLHFGTAEQAAYRASGAGGQIMPVYLSAEKLKRYRDDGTGWIRKIKEAKRAGADGIVYLNRFECMTTADVEDFAARGLLNKLDGMSDLQFKRLYPQAQDSFIVFSPEQVKSALANDGQFRVGQANILLRAMDRFQTPEFKAFFEGSRVVDELGRPRIMYHGTSRDFDTFDRLKSTEWRRPSMDTVGSWFSSDPDRAQGYAGGEGLNIRPVVLSIKNPKVYSRFNDFLRDMHAAEGRVLEEQNPRGIGSTEGLRNKLKAEGYDGIVFEQTDNGRLYRDIERTNEAIRVAKREQWEVPKNQRDQAKLKVQRLEATLASMTRELNDMGGSTEFDGHDVWVAFEPEQIKSAIGNTGEFNPNEASTLRKAGPQTATPEFQEWFGDSKIVDALGRPLVVYHGSAGKEFSVFNRRKLGKHNDNVVSKLGFFFTPDKDIADDYAYQASWNLAPDDRPHNEDDQKVYSVYLAISNPVVIDATEIDGFVAGTAELARLVKEAKKKGHDGAIINNWDDGSGADVQYLAFKPEQIKSATDNNGEFDAANPDITRRALQQVSTPEFKAYFGKSKVVDERGAPKVVYHGTRGDFQAFQSGKHGTNVDNPTTRMGFFFTESAKGADRWANYHSMFSRTADGQNVMPVFLAIEKPRKISATRFLYLLKSARASTINKFIEETMEAGYDGFQIEYDGTGDSGQPRATEQWWVAFKPEQIKSAIGNNGEFDVANPDITRRAMNQTQTPEILSWFDRSQILNEDGQPLVAYHYGSFGEGDNVEPNTPMHFGTRAAALQRAHGKLVDDASMKVTAYLGDNGAWHWDDAQGLTSEDLELPGYSDEITAIELGRSSLIRSMNEDYASDSVSWGVLTPAFLSIKNPKRVIDVGGAEGEWEAEIAKARAEGYDGIVYRNKYEDIGSDSFIAFEPAQIKSAEANSGEFNPNNPSILRSARMPYFYSELQRQIEAAPTKMGKLPAKEWLGWLKSNAAALGIKQDELQWSGLVEYLTLMGAQKLDRSNLVDYLTESGLELEVTQRKAGKVYSILDRGEGEAYRFEVSRHGEPVDAFPIYMDALQFIGDQDDAEEGASRYSGYSLIGGADYTELLITARSRRLPKLVWTASRVENKRADFVKMGFDESVVDGAIELLHETEDDTGRTCLLADRRGQHGVARFVRGLVAGARAKDTRDNYAAQYRSAHWHERNVLAHLRFDIRNDETGRRTMFVQEIQSDWGQEGRKIGFLSKDAFKVVESSKDLYRIVDKRTGNSVELADRVTGFPTRKAAQDAIDDGRVFRAYSVTGVVDGPFVKKTEAWTALAIKHAIVHAAQNGVQAVAFATGEQVAKIFDMKKTVESLSYTLPREGSALGDLAGFNADGHAILSQAVEPQRVAEFVGEEVSAKLFAQPVEYGAVVLDDPGFTVGGRGVMRFYDEVLPPILKDVARKTGIGQVETCDVGFGPQLTLPVSEQLAESLSAQGMPLFRAITTPTDTPEFHGWFRASKVVDKAGAPLVVYHGTVDGRFTTFDLERAGSNTASRDAKAGFFFTNDEDFAAHFLAKRVYDSITGERIYEKNFGVPEIKKVYLSLQNPVDLRKLTLEVAEKLVATGALGKYATARQTVLLSRSAEGSKEIQTNIALARAELEAAGFDGIINKVLYKGKVRTEFMAFNPEQIKSAERNAGSFDPNDADITRRGEVQVHTPEFDRWAAGASLVRLGESTMYRSGVPVVVEALHGSTFADITKFDPSRSHVESNWGRGIYASNTPSDVEANYARENGPDMTNRKNLFIDQLLDNSEAFEEEFQEKGLDVYEASAEDIRAAAQRWADEKFSGGAPNTMKLFMRFQNPAVLGGAGETFLDYVMGEEDTVPSGLLADFLKKMYWPCDGISLTCDELRGIRSAIDEALVDAGDEGLGLSELVSAIEASQTFIDNDEGDLVNSEWLRQMLERLGFDGVIDTTVYEKFAHNVDAYGRKGPERMKGMNRSTVHFIAFDGRQVKSAIGNRGTFDPNDADITRSAVATHRTPEFQAWFAGSQAVDANDRPQVLFHGTNAQFEQPEGTLWLSSSRNVAETYADEPGGRVLAFYASLKNPLVIDGNYDVWSDIEFEGVGWNSDSLVQLARMRGHDGVIVRNLVDGKDTEFSDDAPASDVYVVLGPEQLKSADGNSGEFQQNTADVLRRDLAQSQTPEFTRWFGNSKVSRDGRPLVVYHGASADFNAFDPHRAGQNYKYAKQGMFFCESASAAAEYALEHAKAWPGRPAIPGVYAGQPADMGDGTACIYPVMLSLQKPVVKTIRGHMSPDKWFDKHHEKLYAQVKLDGADGIIVKGDPSYIYADRTLYVALKPEQIKSAFGNRGTFDPNDADITRRAMTQVQTPEFKRWFEGSKVLDDQGKPRVVFHGSPNQFTVFDMSKAIDGAMWFATERGHAGFFADRKHRPGKEPTGKLYEVYLAIRNPLVITQDQLEEAWSAEHPDDLQDERSLLPRDMVERFVQMAKEAGHDGLMIKGFGDLDFTTDVYLAFDPAQIKSATDNDGQFDPLNPDILRSLTPADEDEEAIDASEAERMRA